MSAETAGVDPLASGDPPRIGPYELLGRLGAGGMGQVYLGRAPDGALAAVKAVYPHLAGAPEFRSRFRQEVLAARQISGPHTAAIMDADTDTAVPWLATSYVDGPSLAKLVAERGPLMPDAVRALATGLAEALASVHAAGVIHRDVKPGNVLLADDGPRLIDFGIARALDATSITQTGIAVGSPGYICPERLLGDNVGEPADLYALGAVLYFALTGQPPFGTGEAAQLYYRTVHEEPDVSAVTDPVLRRLITDCLAKDPAARPTTDDVLRRLADPTPQESTVPYQAGATVQVQPYRTRQYPVSVRPGRRRWWIAGLAVTAAVVVIAGVLLALRPGAGLLPGEPGFSWSLTNGQAGDVVGMWNTDASVVVGRALGGLTAYDAATGRKQWSWQPPGNGVLCNMSPTQSDGVGAFDYGGYDADGSLHCDHLQTVSVFTGKLNWAKAISLVGPGAAGFPTQGGGEALSINGDDVSAPFAGSADQKPGPDVQEPDVLFASVHSGTVIFSTNYGANPTPNGCRLSGTATVLQGIYYTVGVCGGVEQVSTILGTPLPVAPLPGCRPISSAFVTGFLATDGHSLVIGCNLDNPDAKLYTMQPGASTPVPVDLSGVDAGIIGYEYGGQQQPANIVLGNGVLYLVGGLNEVNGGPNDSVVAVDMATGKQEWTATLPGNSSVRLLAATDGGVTVVAYGTEPPAMYTVRAPGAVHQDYVLNSGEANAFRKSDDQPDMSLGPNAVAAGVNVAVAFSGRLNSNDTVFGVLPR